MSENVRGPITAHVWINAVRFRRYNRHYSPHTKLVNHTRMEPTRVRVFNTKHITYFKRRKDQLDIYVITITINKVANPFLCDNRKRANVR